MSFKGDPAVRLLLLFNIALTGICIVGLSMLITELIGAKEVIDQLKIPNGILGLLLGNR